MLLKGQNGSEFELGFTRDRLVGVEDGLGDDAWATVNYRAATSEDSWEESAPCINLYEFSNLVEWLEAVGMDAEGEIDEVELLEPELKFAVSGQNGDAVTIRIGFHLIDRPEEFEVDATTEAEFIDLHMPRETVRAAAAQLRAELKRFEGPMKDDIFGLRDDLVGEPDAEFNIIDRYSEEGRRMEEDAER